MFYLITYAKLRIIDKISTRNFLTVKYFKCLKNVVAVMVFLLRWVIPDIPGDLLQKMQREQRLVNELVLKHEMNRHRKSMSEQGTSLRSANTIQQIQQDMVNQSKDREASSGGSRQLKPNIV